MDESSDWIAKSAIAELITLYATLNDSGDWATVASLYTEDGRMSRPIAPDDFITGRAAILESLRARPCRISRHVVANILVTIRGQREASAISQILLFTGSPSADGGLPQLSGSPPLIGTSRDQLVRTEQGWRFVERRGSLDFKLPK
jgi:hypothetical protein